MQELSGDGKTVMPRTDFQDHQVGAPAIVVTTRRDYDRIDRLVDRRRPRSDPGTAPAVPDRPGPTRFRRPRRVVYRGRRPHAAAPPIGSRAGGDQNLDGLLPGREPVR